MLTLPVAAPERACTYATLTVFFVTLVAFCSTIPLSSSPVIHQTGPRVVTIIDIDLIKIIETRLYASREDPRASFGPDVSSSLQPGQRTVPFPIERRGTERSFSDEPL
jgi:hypothetical protein